MGFGVNKALRSKHIFITGISNNNNNDDNNNKNNNNNNDNNNNNNNNNSKTIAQGAILRNFLKKVTRRKMQLLTKGQNYAKSALLGHNLGKGL